LCGTIPSSLAKLSKMTELYVDCSIYMHAHSSQPPRTPFECAFRGEKTRVGVVDAVAAQRTRDPFKSCMLDPIHVWSFGSKRSNVAAECKQHNAVRQLAHRPSYYTAGGGKTCAVARGGDRSCTHYILIAPPHHTTPQGARRESPHWTAAATSVRAIYPQ
jgi:hypothetical protein